MNPFIILIFVSYFVKTLKKDLVQMETSMKLKNMFGLKI